MVTARFLYPDNGYLSDTKFAEEKGLVEGTDYPVRDISVGQSHTSVYLENFPGVFNSVQFEFFEDGEPLDIFRDRRFNPYMGRACE